MKNLLKKLKQSKRRKGFTLVELLVVIVIIAILLSILIASLGKIMTVAEATKGMANMKQMVGATLTWGADHGGRIPSPEYPGGIEVPVGTTEEEFYPEYWDLLEGSGKWLDGVVFAELYLAEQDFRAASDEDGKYKTSGYTIDDEGSHLKGTAFESGQSVKKDPTLEDWHLHSYAMNKNLQYDRIHETSGSTDPFLTEKTMSNLIHAPSAMLYIDCSEVNIVDFQDREKIVETINLRWDGGKGIAGFLDGHVDRLREEDIPDENPEQDLESSRFWRGVDSKNR